MKTIEVLKAARTKIELGWCQGAFCRNENGTDISASDLDSQREWCARGAILTSTDTAADGDDARKLLKLALSVESIHGVSDWNDAPGRTQAEVLAAFDKAIALAESEAS